MLSPYANDVEPDRAETALTHIPAMIRAVTSSHADTIAFTQCMENGMNGSLTDAQVDELSDDSAA